MNKAKMIYGDITEVLAERGLIYDCSDLSGLSTLSRSSQICAYLGFDCTAKSLHVGHLLGLMTILHLLRAGHKAIILLGGATTRIGDPSGKDKTRPTLENAEIESNIRAIQDFLYDWLAKNSGDKIHNLIFENNANWFNSVNYIDFLRDHGKFFSVNEMLTLTSVKERLDRGAPMNFVEFNYVLLQSYDFCELYRRHGCNLQIGGSDQWGNIAHGISVGRKLGMELYGLTVPLLTSSDGRKMGKTENGAVWLNADMLSDFDYWQFFRNVEDVNLAKWWRYFTFDKHDNSVDVNLSKIRLATAATAIGRNVDVANKSESMANVLFGKHNHVNIGEPWLPNRAVKVWKDEVLSAIPEHYLIQNKDNELWNLGEIVRELGFAPSNGVAKDLIRAGAVKINGVVVSEVRVLHNDDFIPNNRADISVGKKHKGTVFSTHTSRGSSAIKVDVNDDIARQIEELNLPGMGARRLGYCGFGLDFNGFTTINPTDFEVFSTINYTTNREDIPLIFQAQIDAFANQMKVLNRSILSWINPGYVEMVDDRIMVSMSLLLRVN